MNNQLTVVIPSKNEGLKLLNTLRYLVSQYIQCRIIIADSSTGGRFSSTRNLVGTFYPDVEVVEGGLPAVARNNGAKLVTTPYILFLDADMELRDSKLIHKALQLAIKKDLDLVTCRFKTTTGDYNWVYRIFDVIQIISWITKPFAIGGFMLFKTETFNQLGGFNEEDKIAEDYHLSQKVRPRKFSIINRYVHTSSRRFRNKGVWYMIKLAWSSWLNRNNDNWYKQDYGYWDKV
jgi:cellulose synthase/poly-beta-1,6-N-acetylglucosamine synthase-like glycosyltransferase